MRYRAPSALELGRAVVGGGGQRLVVSVEHIGCGRSGWAEVELVGGVLNQLGGGRLGVPIWRVNNDPLSGSDVGAPTLLLEGLVEPGGRLHNIEGQATGEPTFGGFLGHCREPDRRVVPRAVAFGAGWRLFLHREDVVDIEDFYDGRPIERRGLGPGGDDAPVGFAEQFLVADPPLA